MNHGRYYGVLRSVRHAHWYTNTGEEMYAKVEGLKNITDDLVR